jgi:hypothetical protein
LPSEGLRKGVALDRTGEATGAAGAASELGARDGDHLDVFVAKADVCLDEEEAG